ncbi:MAG: hypothetical protein SVX43_15000, partial [Cyanobacteriota bacterium]|nr:hypothetical protein [Cyanobacteriota bacterium]
AFELQSPAELAETLKQALKWTEIEALSAAYPHWKAEAWELLSGDDRDRIKLLKRWKNHPVAQKFPLGCCVQRFDNSEGKRGKVINYWSAYGIEYVTFRVGEDIDWCRAQYLKRIAN